MYFLAVKITSSNCDVGLLVARGVDWKWEDEDFEPKTGKPGNGNVLICNSEYMVARVEWANGKRNDYRIGMGNAFDLVLVSGILTNSNYLKQYEIIYRYKPTVGYI